MIRAVVLFLQITLLVFVGVWLASEPGTVTIEWRDWRADAPIGVLALVIGFVALASALAYRLWRFLRQAPSRLVASRRTNRERKGYRALADGMVALASGDTTAALRQGKRAGSLLDQPAATHLLLAQAADLKGDKSAARRHFEAMLHDPGTEFVGLQGLLQQALVNDDKTEALRLARKAAALHPGASWLLPRLFELQAAAGEWSAADSSMAEAMKRKVVPAGDGKRMRAAVLTEQGRRAREAGHDVAALGFMREANDLDPGLVPAAVTYARLLEAEGKKRRATRVLERAWGEAPHPDLAEAYAEMVGGQASIDRVKAGQKLLSFNPDKSVARIFLAEASLQAKLWGEAGKYLEDELAAAPTARVYRLLADLEEQGNEDQEAAKTWLAKASAAPHDRTWLCGDCGAIADEWSAKCEHCDAVASLKWGSPPRATVTELPAAAERPALPYSSNAAGG